MKPPVRITLPARLRADAVGFTLIEVLVSIGILSVIVSIVYASFSAVANTTERARLSAEEMQLRQFLVQSFTSNFSTVYADPECFDERFQFVGVSEEGPDGYMDYVDFSSSAPIMGGMAMPGVLKQVHYGAVNENDPDMTLGSFDSEEDSHDVTLEGSERLLVAGPADIGGSDPGVNEVMGYETPSWSAPIRSFDLAFFDGEEWVQEWDSLAVGRLPWGVRIKIYFADSAESEEDITFFKGDDSEESPDFRLFIPIPMGVGLYTSAEEWIGVAEEIDGADDAKEGDGKGGTGGSGKKT